MSNCIKCKTELPDGAQYCFACGKKQTPTPRKALKRANGLGSVTKLSGRRRKPWCARKNGVLIGTYETKTEALEALAKHVGETMPERYNYTFADVYQEWNAEHFRDLKSDEGVTGYEIAYKKAESLHTKKFRDIALKDFQAVIDAYNHQSVSSRNKIKQLFGQMSKWAMRERIVTINYAPFLKLEPDKPKEEIKTFSDDEIRLLEANDDDQTVRIVLILIYSGMRIGELFSMEWDNVHLEEDYMVGGEKTDAGRDRIIPLHPKVRPYIKELYEKGSSGMKLVSGTTRNKDASNFRNREFYPMLERLGLQKRKVHATRKTFATLAVRAGVKPEALQAILGHASYEVTTKYYVDEKRLELSSAVASICVANSVANRN